MPPIDEVIEQKIGQIRTESLDVSFGELISLYGSEEFIISPDFQRFFRWSDEQKSRLIESILLELPVPQIFVIENEDGVLELIDGLQRISSVIQFIQSDLLGTEPLQLAGCDIVPELDGMQFFDLPLKLRLRIKRTSVRSVVIKRQSTPILRYEMFKRLNTGGSELSEQEIRNCTARMVGVKGVEFYDFLRECAEYPSFRQCTSTMSETDRDKKGDEELVLRFFSLKNAKHLFKGNVTDWLNNYMEAVILSEEEFDYSQERSDFNRLFDYLSEVIGEGAFVRYRNQTPIGGLAPAHFEAVTLGTWLALHRIETVAHDDVRNRLIQTVQSDEFRQFVGPGSNSLTKFKGRISVVESALLGLLQ